jgi:hypothetical protein
MLQLLLFSLMLLTIFNLRPILDRCYIGLTMCSINIDKPKIHVSIVARSSRFPVLYSRKLEQLLHPLITGALCTVFKMLHLSGHTTIKKMSITIVLGHFTGIWKSARLFWTTRTCHRQQRRHTKSPNGVSIGGSILTAMNRWERST